MRNYKKILITTLAAFLLITNTNLPLAYADTEVNTNDNTAAEVTKDTTPPTVDMSSLKVDTKEAKPGDTVTISFKAYDNIPGYFHHIVLTYYSPNISTNGKWKQVHLFDNPYTHECTGTIKINEFTDNGTWICKDVTVCDMSGNETYLKSDDCDLSGLNVNVKNSNEDNEIPVIDYDSIKLSRQDVNFGDSVNVSLKAHDDKSGIKEISVSFMKHGSGSDLWTCYYSRDITLNYNSETNLYEASFTPNDENRLTPGDWILDRICFKDNAGNIATQFTKNEISEAKSITDLDELNEATKYLTLTVSPKTITYTNEYSKLSDSTSIIDLSRIANSYNKTSNDSEWNPEFDLNNDGIIDIYDIVTVSSKMEN